MPRPLRLCRLRAGCSREYLHTAADAIGLGTYFCEWLRVLYDADRPVKRRVNVNGHLGEYFDLGCSTAQGCPASPILFLLIAEGLSRLIRDDPDWAPIVKNKVEHRLSQFADDTCLLM